MANQNTISTQKIDSASQNNIALRQVLTSFAQTTSLTQQVTNTVGKNVPPQCRAQVSLTSGSYTVEIQNPGTVLPTSALQAAQAGASPVQNAGITPIYHQIRCANTPRFSISANVQTFGGNTGSTQTFWTLQLPAGEWYFQIRSSYDGVNFNTWKNANGGQALNQRPETVTVTPAVNSTHAVFTLAGNQLVAFGAGLVPNNGTFTLPDNLYTSAMMAIAGPNGYTDYGHAFHAIYLNGVDVETPSSTAGLTGPADYPIVVPMQYQDGSKNNWPGVSNIFSFAFDPLGSNIQLQEFPTGNWAIFNMAGGWSLAVGSGTAPNGTAIAMPPGFVPASMLSTASPATFHDTGNDAHGIAAANINGAVMTIEYQDDSGDTWYAPGQWFAVAFTPGVPTVAVSGGTFLVFSLPNGRTAGIGAGVVASGTAFGLPPGFRSDQMVSIATPASYIEEHHQAHGVSECAIVGTTPTLVYSDGSGDSWSGNVNWLVFAWQ